MKTGLVLEGGALRTIFSSGVCDAFLDTHLPMPDYTVGVSAGIAYGTSYLSQQSRRNLKLAITYARDPRYVSVRNLLNPRNRALFGLKFSFETIPNLLLPFDYDAFEAYPGVAEAVVTNVNTAQAEYLPVARRQSPNLVLEASCALPMLSPIIQIDGQPYLDGGCADAVPWQRAFDAGCDRVVVVLTRERTYRKDSDGSLGLLKPTFRKYPAFVQLMHTRAERYNASRDALFALEREGKVLVIAPDDTLGCSRMERDLDKLRALWQSGYFAGQRRAEEIRSFWTN